MEYRSNVTASKCNMCKSILQCFPEYCVLILPSQLLATLFPLLWGLLAGRSGGCAGELREEGCERCPGAGHGDGHG